MTRDPTNTQMTEQQTRMLADIFRIFVKEIKSEQDADTLAPGEMGINYKTGSFVIRNPYDKTLFSPNSLTYLKPILNKYNFKTDSFDADTVGGISLYSRLGQLDKLKIDFTPDSVVRQMYSPAIFFGPIEYANYVALGWPSDSGILVAYKSDEEHVFMRFYDNNTYITYEGRYNYHKHMFEGWALGGNSAGDNYAETIGGGNHTDVRMKPYDMELEDLFVLTLRIKEELNPGATISFNGGEPLPIVMRDGEPLNIVVAPNNIIMLVYDKPNRKWVLLESTESALQAIVSITGQRLEVLSKETTQQFIEYERRVNEKFAAIDKANSEAIKHLTDSFDEKLRETVASYEEKLAKLSAAPGNIVTCITNMVMDTDKVKGIPIIPEFDGHNDKLVVNYNQTILRPGVDYIITDTGIDFTDNITLALGDSIQFVVLKQTPIS